MHGIAFICISLNILLCPWAFGSWEMWWFWPMATLIFAGCLFSGIGSLFGSTLASSADGEPESGHYTLTIRILALLATIAPFLIYATVRARFPSAPNRPLVAMDAERSLLLFFTPVAIGLVIFLSFTRQRLRRLFTAVLINAVVLAIYAGINQWLTYGEDKPDYVLWVLTPWGYGDRAKGSFFCPNHLSAYLNLGLCLCTAMIFTPRTSLRARLGLLSVAVVIATTNFMTLSRGGIASLLIGLFIGIPLLAMRGQRIRSRIIAPVVVLAVTAASLLTLSKTHNPLMQRIEQHPLYRTATKNVGSPEWRTKLHDAFWYSFDRGTYIQSALRAWKSNPVWGIGPGQHSSRWTEFAATDDGLRPVDGDLSTLKKPRLTNSGYHLYEVHSDWTQLLEEYGMVGLALFLIPMGLVFALLFITQSETIADARKQAESRMQGDTTDAAVSNEAEGIQRRRSSRRHPLNRQSPLDGETLSPVERALPLAAQLAILILSIHSLGDFSLQIPSITWLFGAMIAGGVLATNETHR